MENGCYPHVPRTFLVRVWRCRTDYNFQEAPVLRLRFAPTVCLVDFVRELRGVWIGEGQPATTDQGIEWDVDSYPINAVEASLDPSTILKDVSFFSSIISRSIKSHLPIHHHTNKHVFNLIDQPQLLTATVKSRHLV